MFDDQSGILLIGRNDDAVADTEKVLAAAFKHVKVTVAAAADARVPNQFAAGYDLVVFDLTGATEVDSMNLTMLFAAVPVVAILEPDGQIVPGIAHDYLVRGCFSPELLEKSIQYASERYSRLDAEKKLAHVTKTLKIMRRQISSLTDEVRAARTTFTNLCAPEPSPSNV